MRPEIEDREPARDPALAEALLEVYADAPVPQQRLDALRARIRARAEAVVAESAYDRSAEPESRGPKRGGSWRRVTPAHRRMILAAPALLAAAVAGILLLHPQAGRRTAPISQAPIQAVGYGTPEQALTSTASDAEFARTVADGSDPTALLAIAVGEGSSPAQ